jgi:hypothetical protein
MRHSLVVLIAGHPPLFYAMQQRDGVMAKALQKLGAKLDKKESQLARQESFIDADKWVNDYGIPAVRAFRHTCPHVRQQLNVSLLLLCAL